MNDDEASKEEAEFLAALDAADVLICDGKEDGDDTPMTREQIIKSMTYSIESDYAEARPYYWEWLNTSEEYYIEVLTEVYELSEEDAKALWPDVRDAAESLLKHW